MTFFQPEAEVSSYQVKLSHPRRPKSDRSLYIGAATDVPRGTVPGLPGQSVAPQINILEVHFRVKLIWRQLQKFDLPVIQRSSTASTY